MWNFFKSKAVEAPVQEKMEPVEDINVSKIEKPEAQDSESIDVRLDVLSNYLRDCEESGIDLTDEMVKSEIESVLGIGVEDLLEEKIGDPEVKGVSQNISARVQEMMDQKATDQKTTLGFLREKVFKSNFAKAAFVTAILFLKFSPAHAENKTAEKDAQVKNKIEASVKKANNMDGGDKKVYDSTEDFKSVEKKVKIEANRYFDTDKADLKDASSLSGEFDKFLSTINDSNFEKIMDKNWVVKGSSDERGTSNWHGSNEELTKARIDAFTKVLEETLKSHDFSKQLSADKAQKILEKPINGSYPTGGAEKGVTYLSNLMNPETGKTYTQSEIKSLKENNAGEYQKLLDKCRYTNFETESSMFELDAYDKCIILVDDSPSMSSSKVNMAGELKYVNADKPVSVAYFSDHIDGEEQKKNSQEAAVTMMKMPTGGASSERALFSATQYLEKMAGSEKDQVAKGEKIPSKIMYVATDEALQDANLVLNLSKLAAKTNTDLKFLMFYEDGSKVIKLSLQELNDKVNKNIETEIKGKQEQANRSLLSHEAKVNSLIDKVIEKRDSNFGEVASALESCGIKGSVSEMKKLLSEKSIVDLGALSKVSWGRMLYEAKWNLETAKDNKIEADNLTVLKQLASSDLKINVLEDKDNKSVKFPIY